MREIMCVVAAISAAIVVIALLNLDTGRGEQQGEQLQDKIESSMKRNGVTGDPLPPTEPPTDE
jgi:hypothetical protein